MNERSMLLRYQTQLPWKQITCCQGQQVPQQQENVVTMATRKHGYHGNKAVAKEI